MSEDRKAIEREIFRLRNAINLQLRANNGEVANRLRDKIGELESQI